MPKVLVTNDSKIVTIFFPHDFKKSDRNVYRL